MPPDEAVLMGGPQDGARVRCTGGLPMILHLGPKWLGDGFSAWARRPSKRFPARYLWDGRGDVYHFHRYETERAEVNQEPCKG